MGVEVVYEPGDPFVDMRFRGAVTTAQLDDAGRLTRAAIADGAGRVLTVFEDAEAAQTMFKAYLSSETRSVTVSVRRAFVDPWMVFSTAAAKQVFRRDDKTYAVFDTREAAVAWLLADEQEGE